MCRGWFFESLLRAVFDRPVTKFHLTFEGFYKKISTIWTVRACITSESHWNRDICFVGRHSMLIVDREILIQIVLYLIVRRSRWQVFGIVKTQTVCLTRSVLYSLFFIERLYSVTSDISSSSNKCILGHMIRLLWHSMSLKNSFS